MATRKRKEAKKPEPVTTEVTPSITIEVIPVETEVSPLPIGQQVRVTAEVKGPGGVMRAGTTTVIEGCQMTGEKVQYKVLHRGFRFWVPGEIVEKL